MLNEIIDTKDLDLSNYRDLKKILEELTIEDYRIIKKMLNEFRSTLYTTEYDKVIDALDLSYNGVDYHPSKFIHAIYHVEKVFLYCYIMVKYYNNSVLEEEKIPDEFITILFYAAFYHDIGRLDNSEEPYHGLNSAKAFNVLFKDEPFFKENKYRLYLVEYLMNSHSRPDEVDAKLLMEDIFSQHEEDWELPQDFLEYIDGKYEILNKLLKDADALDRKRFGEWFRESLNPDFLRTSFAKDLIGFASDINRLYYSLSKRNYIDIDLSECPVRDCFHSIGFDFFKIKSIIENGILSQDELKKNNIIVPRNFPGGNFDRWISVVDATLYPDYVWQNENSKDKYASSEFTDHGITFFCNNIPLISPLSRKERDNALEIGMPWDKSGYKDEKYALNKIPSENIIGLFIPFEYKDKSVFDLRYIYESTNMDIIRDRVAYYRRYTMASIDSIEISELDILLDTYEKIILKELNQPRGSRNSQEYISNSKLIVESINHIISIWIYNYYKVFLGDNFSVSDVIKYELSKIPDLEFSIADNEEAIEDANPKELFIAINKKNYNYQKKLK